MRISSFATLLGLSFVACTVGDNPGGGDDDTPPGCGNNTMDPGEQCDDGNTVSGDGCSSSCQMETAPRIDVSVDKATVASELNTTNMLTFTVTGSDGFTGDVTLSASVVDAAQAPLAGWTITLDKTTLTIPTNGTGTAVGTLVIPSENKGLTGTVKVTATTAVPRATGTMLATSTVNVTNQITFTEKLNANGQCVYPAAENVKVTIGTAIRFLNTDTVKNITTHIQGVNNTTGGLQHQPDPGSAPGTAYVQTATKAGSNSWYCHAPGPDPGPILVIQSVP